MSGSRFDEAPPLPREPTALSVPEAMGVAQRGDEAVELPVDAHALPPPPKFPSLTDVGLPHAQAAAAGLTPAPPAAPPAAEAADDVGEVTRPLSTSSALDADIETAIARYSVVPGTGAKKVIEVGQQLWTDQDQEQLDKLLADGLNVYVPPDVAAADLPTVRRSTYIPVPSEDGVVPGVDSSPDSRSIQARIDQWNQVVPQENEKDDRGVAAAAFIPVPAPVPGLDASAADEGAVLDSGKEAGVEGDESAERAMPPPEPVPGDRDGDQSIDQGTADELTGEAPGSTAVERSAEPEAEPSSTKNADVSKSIFGGSFFTVPVTSRKGRAEDTAAAPAAGATAESTQMVEGTMEVALKSDSSAHIDITHDYGLKGGHANGVNDVAFLDDDKFLVTCGDDGKVCIWDMSDHTVEREFEPYGGEPVTMVHPIPEDNSVRTKTIMTLSKNRDLCIWIVDDKQAIKLRSTKIQDSDRDLYMSVPVISKELKARAAAAAAAAAVTTTDAPEIPAQMQGSDAVGDTAGPGAAVADTAAAAPIATEAAVTAAAQAAKEEEKDTKKFSFTKVLSFGRSSSSRKAVAS